MAMRKIKRLDLKSMLWVFAVFYAVVGLCVASKAVIVDDESIQCPFGLAYPLCTLYLYLTVHLPHPATWMSAGIIVIAVVFYALTGLMSGAAVVFAYNAVARFWPLLSAKLEDDTVTHEPDQSVSPI